MSKYNARRTEYPPGSGQVYDSRGEAEYARQLDLLLAAGRLRSWRRGRPWLLLEPPNKVTYTPDFEVTTLAGELRCLDFKGVLTEVFRLKAKLFRARYPGVPLIVVKEGDSALGVVAGDAPAAGAARPGRGRRRVPRGAA